MRKICSFTIPELNKIRELANFTDEELEYFNMKANDKSNIYISVEMCVSESKVSSLARRVKSKINRIIE